MTVKELIDILLKYPEDTTVVYRHNKYGRIDIDYADFTEEVLLSGEKIKLLTLEASFEED